jgi:hypothetical protein
MKAVAKRFVQRTAKNKFGWFAYKTCGQLSNYLAKIYGHARFTRETTERDEKLIGIAGELFPDLTVATGPFRGLRYPSLRSVGSALVPKLLGSYESELHNVLENFLSYPYACVVDIGCAEGYYAVGLGLRLKVAEIYAFDTNERAREACAEMARLNGVAERIHIGGFCDAEMLRSLPLGHRALAIVDCEGYEKTLFNSQIAAFLARHDLIIEAHDFIDIDISINLRQVFSKTHRIQSIKSTDDIEKAHTYHYSQLRQFDTHEKRMILAERRPGIMEWLVMTPLVDTERPLD